MISAAHVANVPKPADVQKHVAETIRLTKKLVNEVTEVDKANKELRKVVKDWADKDEANFGRGLADIVDESLQRHEEIDNCCGVRDEMIWSSGTRSGAAGSARVLHDSGLAAGYFSRFSGSLKVDCKRQQAYACRICNAVILSKHWRSEWHPCATGDVALSSCSG